MAVKIRLKRFGKVRSPHYRIVVMDSRQKRNGRAIEEIGQYHPKNDPSIIEVNSERAQYWLGVGAQATEAVVAIFKRSGDWQKFSGDKTPSGIDPQPVKADKTEYFNKALADGADQPTVEAFSAKKKADEDAKAAEKEAAEKAEKDEAEKAGAKSDAKDYGEGSYRGEDAPEGFDIKGNEDSMKFHTPESPWYGRTVAEVWFNSAEAAEKAGFANAVADKADDDKAEA